MRVICISDVIPIKPGSRWGPEEPKFGDVDAVIKEVTDEDGDFYGLERFPGWLYSTYHFIPLSDIDETKIRKRRTNRKNKKLKIA